MVHAMDIALKDQERVSGRVWVEAVFEGMVGINFVDTTL